MKKNLLEKYKKEIQELTKKKYINAIIIFGSYAKQNQKPLSDLDICLITDKISKKQEKELLSFKTEELDITLFHKLSLPLQYQIITQGKTLHTKTDLITTKNQITNQWFDFRPTLNRIYLSKNLLPII